jgi:hypothetical protein
MAGEIVVEDLNGVSSAELRVAGRGRKGDLNEILSEILRELLLKTDYSVQVIPCLSYHTPMLRFFSHWSTLVD